MSVIMLSFMMKTLEYRCANLAIYTGSALLFLLSLWLVRSQATVEDVSYMKAMLPHPFDRDHDSERARIRDPRARKLADRIIGSQREEILEMGS